MPMFTVIVPTYNRAHTLPGALASILTQGVDELEVIVIDDGSNDDTRDVVAAIDDDRLRYVYQAQAGVSAARNHGARLATGTLLTFLDSDDEALPGWLGAYLDMFERGLDVVSCGCVNVRRAGGSDVEEVQLPSPMLPLFPQQTGMFIHGGTYAMRLEVFQRLGGFIEDLRSAEHTELSMRLVPRAATEGWTIGHVPEAYVRYRVGSHDGLRGNDEAVLQGAEYLLDQHRGLLRTVPRHHATMHAVAGVRAARLGRYGTARNHFVAAARITPRQARVWARVAAVSVPGLRGTMWSDDGRRGFTDG